eukprot:Amastigsp_a676559_9.p1 type:complete len:411 gc:universal Amastigsp_a676559_9:1292-60(-)
MLGSQPRVLLAAALALGLCIGYLACSSSSNGDALKLAELCKDFEQPREHASPADGGARHQCPSPKPAPAPKCPDPATKPSDFAKVELPPAKAVVRAEWDCPILSESTRVDMKIDRKRLLEELSSFIELYKTRPYGRADGGMLLDHSFHLYMMLRLVKPDFVIEAGVFQGHTTWLIHKTLPNAYVFSLDPHAPAADARAGFGSPRHRDLTGPNFVDFWNVNWDAELTAANNGRAVDKTRVFVLLDDHQSALKRVMQGIWFGFAHFFFDDNISEKHFETFSKEQRLDNYADNFSMRDWCGLEEGPLFFRDNFNNGRLPQTAASVATARQVLRATGRQYMEAIPIVSSALSKRTIFHDGITTTPLISDLDAPDAAAVKRLFQEDPLGTRLAYHYYGAVYLGLTSAPEIIKTYP